MLLEDIKLHAIKAASQVTGLPIEQVSIEFPEKFGDLAVNCFHLAKAARKSPQILAVAMRDQLAGAVGIEAAEAVSGYVNLSLNRSALFDDVIRRAMAASTTFGHVHPDGRKRRILVEFSSPNTNKPQHLGHVRNNCLGDALARILKAAGREVVKANLINDRGIHICKSMLAYQRLGGGKTPESEGIKGDHFVGDYYVLFNRHLDEEFKTYLAGHPEARGMDKDDFFKISEWGRAAQSLLQRWENNDPEVVELWKTMNGWVIAGFEATYRALGIQFDRVYLESETYVLGKEIIRAGLDRGVFQKRDDGAIEIDLTAEKLDRKVVLRSDGTSVYITQDIGTTVMKAEEHLVDGQVFVVGNEQIHHFRVLFTILKKLGYPWADGLFHLAYGMVNLPEGKMKSREGTVVDADDLLEEVTALALEEIRRRNADTEDAIVQPRARTIGLAALKFMLLSVSPTTTMVYDPKASVNFEGDTGPYVLYAYARIRRMMEDGGCLTTMPVFESRHLGEPSEVRLALQLLMLDSAVQKAAADANPSLVVKWLLDTAHAYHSYHRAVPILKADQTDVRAARLALSVAVANALRSALLLLGIEPVDRM